MSDPTSPAAPPPDSTSPAGGPAPVTPVGTWLDRTLGPAARPLVSRLLGLILFAAASFVAGRYGCPAIPVPDFVPLKKTAPAIEPAKVEPDAAVPPPVNDFPIGLPDVPDDLPPDMPPAAVPPARVADGDHRIPRGGDLAHGVEVLRAAEAGPPVYRLPPDELVPHAMERVAGETQDWGLAFAGVPQAWARGKGSGVKVAVLDTGIDTSHPDLRGAIVATRDFTGSASGVSDVQGHGTHTAGTIGARSNGVGVVGWAPEVSLIVGKVLGDDGSGQSPWIAAGIDWAASQGADVVSLSLGSPRPDEGIRAAIQRARARGVIVVCAAGNEGPGEGTVGYPGGFAEAVCVAAVDSKGAVASFSSRGAAVLVAAPGVNIVSDYPGGRLATMSGTSMATPAVSACAALWVAAHPEVAVGDRPAAFVAALKSTSKDIPPPGRDTATGVGLVQPAALVAGSVPPPAVIAPPGITGPITLTIDPTAKTITAPGGWSLK